MTIDFFVGMAAGLIGAYVIQAAAYIVADWWVGREEGEQQ